MKLKTPIVRGSICLSELLSLPDVFIAVRSLKATPGDPPGIWVGHSADIIFTKEGDTISTNPKITRRLISAFDFPNDDFGRVLDPAFLDPEQFKLFKKRRGRIYKPTVKK